MKKDIAVKNLPNIGTVLANELENAGIKTLADLKKHGSAGALYIIKGISGKGCYNMLYALEGAIKQIRWHDLSAEEKSNANVEFTNLLSEKEFNSEFPASAGKALQPSFLPKVFYVKTLGSIEY